MTRSGLWPHLIPSPLCSPPIPAALIFQRPQQPSTSQLSARGLFSQLAAQVALISRQVSAEILHLQGGLPSLSEGNPLPHSLQPSYSISVMCVPKFYIYLLMSLFTVSSLAVLEHLEDITHVRFIHHSLTAVKDQAQNIKVRQQIGSC